MKEDIPAEEKPDIPDGQSRVARAYRLKKSAAGQTFTDLQGRTYGVNPDGSMRRLDKKISKKKRLRMEAAKNGKTSI